MIMGSGMHFINESSYKDRWANGCFGVCVCVCESVYESS